MERFVCEVDQMIGGCPGRWRGACGFDTSPRFFALNASRMSRLYECVTLLHGIGLMSIFGDSDACFRSACHSVSRESRANAGLVAMKKIAMSLLDLWGWLVKTVRSCFFPID